MEEQIVVGAFTLAGAFGGAYLNSLFARARERREALRQEETLKMQLQHASAEAIRGERRKAYAAFMGYLRRVNVLAVEICKANSRGTRVPDSVRQNLMAQQNSLMREWMEALLQLELLGSQRIGDMSSATIVQWSENLEHAWSGESPTEPSWQRPSEIVHTSALLAAMQSDLGISDGVIVDPITGLYQS